MSDSDHRSALQIDHPALSVKWPENTTRALLKTLKWSDFTFQMNGTSWLTEGFNFHIFTEDGSAIFLQFVYSNLAWPSCTAVVNVRYYRRKDNKVFAFQETYKSYRLKRADKKLHVKVADTELQYVPPEMEAEHPKFIYKHRNKDFGIVLEMEPTQPPMQVGHGETRYGKKGSDGYLLFQFVPCVKVRGEMQCSEGKIPIIGRGIIIHQFQGVRPNIASTRFDVVYFSQICNEKCSKNIDLFMVQFHTPIRYGGYTINVGFMTDREELVALSTGKTEMVGATKHDEKTGYNLPTELLYEWSGTNVHGQSFQVEGSFKPQKPIASISVLDHIPFFIRKAVEILVARPHIYKWLDDAQFNVKIEGSEELKLEGSLYHEISFVNKE